MPGNFIMPQSDDRVLCVCITTRITRDWFLGNARIADEIIARHGEMRLLVYYKNYQGWDEDATREDSSAFINQGSYFRKFAYVNPPEKTLLRQKMRLAFFSGELRVFKEEELEEAVKWVKE